MFKTNWRKEKKRWSLLRTFNLTSRTSEWQKCYRAQRSSPEEYQQNKSRGVWKSSQWKTEWKTRVSEKDTRYNAEKDMPDFCNYWEVEARKWIQRKRWRTYFRKKKQPWSKKTPTASWEWNNWTWKWSCFRWVTWDVLESDADVFQKKGTFLKLSQRASQFFSHFSASFAYNVRRRRHQVEGRTSFKMVHL